MKRKKAEILLVEDNADDAELALLAIKKTNIIEDSQIHVVRDGVEALKYLFDTEDTVRFEDNIRLNHCPLLILLDLNLPKLDGLDLLKKIKSHPEAKKIPVIILTSSREERDIIESYHLGANSYIQKPVDFNQFTEAVKLCT